jgi:glutamate-1-semialdehyde 2,1-aminomutase
MSRDGERALGEFRARVAEEFTRRFPRSAAHFERCTGTTLDGASHAMRWVTPFMPVMRRAAGSIVEDLDGNRFIDYWQGHFANLLGHNPPLVRRALVETLEERGGLQTGMLHEVEAEVCEQIARMTRTETVRLTTSGSLGTFYAALLARSFTGREVVLKVSGGWHGSQPFGLKGVSVRDGSFDHLESEGLSRRTADEVALTRFNDVEDLRRVFARTGDRIACFLLEPMLGSGGGIVAQPDYLREARRLTHEHGALLVCDEIITGFRFRPGDFTAAFGVKPDLLVLGKIVGGGMPVAAVAGRRDVLELATRTAHRVKFEGGTYSAHELCLVAARAMLSHLEEHAGTIYPQLAERGERLRQAVARTAREAGLPVHVAGGPAAGLPGGSFVGVHAVREGTAPPTGPEELAERANPLVPERLLKAVLLLEGLSTRSGCGAISTAHTDDDLVRTVEAMRAGWRRFVDAGLAGG